MRFFIAALAIFAPCALAYPLLTNEGTQLQSVMSGESVPRQSFMTDEKDPLVLPPNSTIVGPHTNTTCATSTGLSTEGYQPALYTENARPQIHYSPSSGFMNDPNGLMLAGDGTWHLYYQYNPVESVAGNQHWGHATSKNDLYHWQNHPPALQPHAQDENIFSGSAVIDTHNTSGFFDADTPPGSRFVALYTLNTTVSETQNVAYSTDGQHYTNYIDNPVLALNSTQFRDPKVFYDDKASQWIMTVAHSQEYQVGFYASRNLRDWTELSRFGPAGLLGYQYECPDLVQVSIQGGAKHGQTAWVLVLSINPGGATGGSSVLAFVGDWDGYGFKPWDGSVQMVDFGKDFYAVQSFYNAPEKRAIVMGWASDWQYTNTVPTSPWRGAMTVPREMFVRWVQMNGLHYGYQVTMEPYGLDHLPKHTLDQGAKGTDLERSLHGHGAFSIRVTFSLPAGAISAIRPPRAELRIKTPNAGEHLRVGVLFGDPATSVYVDRRFAGRQWSDDEPTFTDRFSQPVMPKRRAASKGASELLLVELHLIVDRTVTELFAQDGTATAVVLHFWDNDARPDALTVDVGDAASEIKVESLHIDVIDPTWAGCP